MRARITRITRTNRWKIIKAGITFLKITNSNDLDKLYEDYLDMLSSKYPNEKYPIYYHND